MVCPGLTVYVLFSAILALLLYIDPHIDRPSGLIKLAWFTAKPVSHGLDACSYDYEGSWRIGMAHGSPLHLALGAQPAITCAQVTNLSVSFVADPVLHIPAATEALHGKGSWFAFYEMKNMARYIGEIGVASTSDNGSSWTHLGTALSEQYHLSYPWVTYDSAAEQYIMIPETSGSADGTIHIYTTSPSLFPFGWTLVQKQLSGARYVDTSPVFFNGSWWIFTTKVGKPGWGQPKYTLLLFTASEGLLGLWVAHPSNPLTVDRRYARCGGPPFVLDGSVYRWAQDCSNYYGESLHLLRATDLSSSNYSEAHVQQLWPSRNASSWYGERLHQASVVRLDIGSDPQGSSSNSSNSSSNWVALLDGDPYRDGYRHFAVHEGHFVQLKAALLQPALLQLAIVLLAVVLWRYSGTATRKLCHAGSALDAASQFLAKTCLLLAPHVAMAAVVGGSICTAGLIMAVLPAAVSCPRWGVWVKFTPVPPVRHVDHAAPYDVNGLHIITGCTTSFFDRLENLIGSLQVWEPGLQVSVYDLGFSSDQLAQIGCWEGVQLLRFPFELYPPHVADISTYAFKALALNLSLATAPAVLWLDCGLELRAPLDDFREQLALHGHVSAEQMLRLRDLDFSKKYIIPFHNISDAEWGRIQDGAFCAGGLQGFVKGSDAERLILAPTVACSLDELRCIAPFGHSRAVHTYDQASFTALIRLHNFSCLPRQLYCTSAVKKLSYNPRASSHPIKLASRRHRLPKPYASAAHARCKRACTPDPARNPWRSMGMSHAESNANHTLYFVMVYVYLQKVGDFFVMACACPGVHVLVQGLFWIQVWIVLRLGGALSGGAGRGGGQLSSDSSSSSSSTGRWNKLHGLDVTLCDDWPEHQSNSSCSRVRDRIGGAGSSRLAVWLVQVPILGQLWGVLAAAWKGRPSLGAVHVLGGWAVLTVLQAVLAVWGRRIQ